MDQLFQRYADPFSFINGYIQTHRFLFFVESFISMRHEDLEEKYKWEFYLHKVFDKSFDEWNQDAETMSKNQNMSKEQLETTLNKSLSILNNFNPSQKGG